MQDAPIAPPLCAFRPIFSEKFDLLIKTPAHIEVEFTYFIVFLM